MLLPMRFSFKAILSGTIFLAYVAWDNVGKPIWSVNVERWAEQRHLDQTINNNIPNISVPVMPTWGVDWVNYLTGDFLAGAACLGALFIAIDAVKWLNSANRRRKERQKEKLNPEALRSKYLTLAAMIRANEPFFESDHFDSLSLRLAVHEVAYEMQKMTGEDGMMLINSIRLAEWAPVLEKLAGHLGEGKLIRRDDIKAITNEFVLPQLPQGTEEKTQP